MRRLSFVLFYENKSCDMKRSQLPAAPHIFLSPPDETKRLLRSLLQTHSSSEDFPPLHQSAGLMDCARLCLNIACFKSHLARLYVSFCLHRADKFINWLRFSKETRVNVYICILLNSTFVFSVTI